MLYNGLTWFINSTIHMDNQLILEANISVQEEVIEVLLECSEQ